MRRNKHFLQVSLTQVQPINPLNRDFVAAAQEAGFPQVEFNTKQARENFRDCVGYFQLNTFASLKERCSSATAYLHPLNQLPHNLSLFLDTFVRLFLALSPFSLCLVFMNILSLCLKGHEDSF